MLLASTTLPSIDKADRTTEPGSARGSAFRANLENVKRDEFREKASDLGNQLVLLDTSKGRYVTDESGLVTGVE